MIICKIRYGIVIYFVGALLARLSDEMGGQTLLLLCLAVSHSIILGADVLATLTVSAAVGGPLLGSLMDRTPQPGRVLAVTLSTYAIGFALLATTLGHIPLWASLTVAWVVGSLTSTISGGWSSRLPDVVRANHLGRASAVDAASYHIAGLAGPASAGLLVMAWSGVPVAMLLSVLILAAVPAAWQMPTVPRPENSTRRLWATLWSGLRTSAISRTLRRATLVSAVSYFGFGMISVIAPLVALTTWGHAGFGGVLLSVLSVAALLITVIYQMRRKTPPFRAEISGADPGGVNPAFPVARCIA